MITLSSFVETIYGKFAKGKEGLIFYSGVGDTFLAKKEKDEDWKLIEGLLEKNGFYWCEDLLNEKIPPQMVRKLCYDNDSKKNVEYKTLYNKQYK